MAGPETPLPPIEIPWRLASTTQPLAAAGPAETAMSLFFFEPDSGALANALPDERLVFVKVTVSISPIAFPAALSRVAAGFLGEGIPCMHLQLDLAAREAGGQSGSIRPYFHAAAPLSRTMVQSGVIGIDSYEGEAEGLAIGKSGSQMHETLRSHSSTSSSSGSVGISLPFIGGLGGSVSSTSTDLASTRNVGQVVDTTSRNASEERRELISHTTRVENVISLLSAKYVGTPHLRFSLSPRPLQRLAADPADPNLWFQQLLARRSSGLEGIQEFTAVLVVPKGMDFCMMAKLRRVCLLDSPPGPLTFAERYQGGFLQVLRMLRYLYSAFPVGTPLDDLDIDILGGLANSNTFKRPVVSAWEWAMGEELWVAQVQSPAGTAGTSKFGRVNYKHFLEVWLDTLRYEYEQEVARSPLERGIAMGEYRFLDTCFNAATGERGITVHSSNSSLGRLSKVPLDFGAVDIGGVRTAGTSGSARTRASAAVNRWTLLESRAASLLANGKELDETPLSASDPAVLRVLVDTWRKLPADDARNVPLDEAVRMLGLPAGTNRVLAAAGAVRLSDVAAILHSAPDVERHNAEVRRVAALAKARKTDGPAPVEISLGFGSKEAAAALATIGRAISAGAAD